MYIPQRVQIHKYQGILVSKAIMESPTPPPSSAAHARKEKIARRFGQSRTVSEGWAKVRACTLQIPIRIDFKFYLYLLLCIDTVMHK